MSHNTDPRYYTVLQPASRPLVQSLMHRQNRTKTDTATGWYIAVVVERFEYYDEDASDAHRKCNANENMILIQADSPEEAYSRAVENGTALTGVECVDDLGRKGEFKFVGLNELLPIYDKFEHGAEILWTCLLYTSPSPRDS